MAASFSTILILGGTSGIGEAFARRFHAMGKSLILTGRRSERLRQLEKELPGTKGYEWDFANITETPKRIDQIFADHPQIDTVWINGGVMSYNSFKDFKSVADEDINTYVTTNLTAPMVIAHHIIPRFLAAPNKPANFLITTSGVAFIPVPFSTIYASTKGGLHHFTVGLRQQLKDTHVNVIEIVPPMVGTDALHSAARAGAVESSTAKAMPMDEYVKETFAILDSADARDLKEVAAGSAVRAVQTWREGTGALLESAGLSDSKSL